MANAITTALNSLRQRPIHERKLLAATTFVTAAVVVVALWITSLNATLSPLAEVPPATESRELHASEASAPSPDRNAPQAPLAAMRQAFGAAITESKNLITEFRNNFERAAGELPNLTAKPQAPQEPPQAQPSPAEQPPLAPRPAAPEAGPAKTVAAARTSSPYSSYAAARALSAPLDVPVAAPKRRTSRIRTIIAYNLGELRHAARDVFEYFTH